MDSATVQVSLLDNVTLACEIYGFFPSDLPEITWLFDNQEVDSGDVTVREGSRSIQNGGNDVIPSVISELMVYVDDSSSLGQYSCQIIPDQARHNITLMSREEMGRCNQLFPLNL